jgi:poly-gamma-glutamate synthesis protein (capsule biosynthesis protein)
MGVDIVSLANNHALDYGAEAFLDTLDLLDENDIKYVGAGRDLDDAMRYEIFEVNDITIAFVSASRVVPDYSWYAGKDKPGVFATYDPADLNKQIAAAKTEVDFCIVYVHWGVEKNDTPEGYQRDMAKSYIDNGADVVIGSHPHVLQGFEFYNDKPIVYSLGNFIFTDAAKDTMAVTLFLQKDTPIALKVTPYKISNLKTAIVEDAEKLRVFKENLENISFGVTVDDDWMITPR